MLYQMKYSTVTSRYPTDKENDHLSATQEDHTRTRFQPFTASQTGNLAIDRLANISRMKAIGHKQTYLGSSTSIQTCLLICISFSAAHAYQACSILGHEDGARLSQ